MSHGKETHRGVAVLDPEGARVVVRALVEELHAVLLGGDGGGQVDGDHLEEGVARRQPLPHHGLQ